MPEKSVRISIYLLERSDTPQPDEWAMCIVAASSEAGARELANQQSGSEGYVWNDGQLVTSTILAEEASDNIDGVLMFGKEKES